MFKRGSVWWTKIRYQGKIIQKSLETTDKKLAKSIEAKIRIEIIEGKYFERLKVEFFSVNGLIEKYLDDHSKPNKKEKVYQDDIYFSRKISQHFGKLNISEVSAKHISAFIKKRRKDGVQDITIRHELVLLRHAFNLAVEQWELIKQSPFTKKSIPKTGKKRVRYLSDDEEERLFAVLPKWLEPIVIFARETGLRLSNVGNLLWSQVNLAGKIIVISETEMKNNQPLGIPMSTKVYEILINQNRIRRPDCDYVFFKKDGQPHNRFRISRIFRETRKKAGIENFRFHDLRHDFCSRLVQRGVPLYTVAALAGHQDIKMTQRYAHLRPEGLRSALKVFDVGYNLATVEEKTVSQKHITN